MSDYKYEMQLLAEEKAEELDERASLAETTCYEMLNVFESQLKLCEENHSKANVRGQRYVELRGEIRAWRLAIELLKHCADKSKAEPAFATK